MFLLQLLIALLYYNSVTDAMDRFAKRYREDYGYVGLEWLHRFNSEIWLGGGEACAREAESSEPDYAQCSFVWVFVMVYLDLRLLTLAFTASGGVFLLIIRWVLVM